MSATVPLAAAATGVRRGLRDRIVSLNGRGDVAARLLRESLADGLRLHVQDQYGEGRPRASREARPLSLSEQQRLVEFIRDGLSSEIAICRRWPALSG
ncbi:hypothetical protein [Mycolicibacterium fortuitum]|uniref:hypothetical protein n=1 Tax=Mycolicibacterium fortuitum TaxID=1766 RepID=UPI00260818D3|nr:hypothetical protein [Mycolicibacterium fortuitum]